MFFFFKHKKSLSAITLMLASASASANYFTFDFTDGANIGSGSFFTDAENIATAGTLTVTGGADVGTYTLLNYTGGGLTISPYGAFQFDNQVYPSSDPILNSNGLLFTGFLDGNALEINIWGNPPSGNGFYSFYSWESGVSYNVASANDVTFNAIDPPAPAPEPMSLSLFGIGLVLLGASRRRIQAAA